MNSYGYVCMHQYLPSLAVEVCKESVHSLVDCHAGDRREKSLEPGGDRGEEHLGYLGVCVCVCVCVEGIELGGTS